jgi:hypothetical protein
MVELTPFLQQCDSPLHFGPLRRSMEGVSSTDGMQNGSAPVHERAAASARPKRTYSLSNALVIAAFVAWVSKTIWGFRAILDPMRNITLVPGEPTLQNLWKQGTHVSFVMFWLSSVCFVSVRRLLSACSLTLYQLH